MPSIGMLLCKNHSCDPPTSAASAPLPPTKAPSTSENPQATANDPTSSDDGPPPPKSRRQTTLAINAAKRQGTPLEAEQVPMSTKQSKRAYKVVSSAADGKAGSSRSSKKRAPLADVTNSAAVPAATSTRRKRAATKQLDSDWNDSASDGGSSSSSDFMPDADHVSEDEVDAGEHSDLDADDLDIGVSSSDTGEESNVQHRTYKHPVWTYYSIDEKTLKFTCRSCLTKLSSKTKSNDAKKHLRVRHADLYGELVRTIAETGYAKKIGLDELETHTTNIAQHWNRDSGILRCPVCSFEVKTRSPSQDFKHLLHHLGDKCLFPYCCPIRGCDQVSVLPEVIRRHVKCAHKLDWTDKLAASCVHAKNKARLDALLAQVHKTGTVLYKNQPPDPLLDAASANPASLEHPSTSKDVPATSKRQVSCADGSSSVGATSSVRIVPKCAPLADLTNHQMPSRAASSRPKSAATKPPARDTLDSASEERNRSSSEFQLDADRVSEVDELADFGDDDRDAGHIRDISDGDAINRDCSASSSNTGRAFLCTRPGCTYGSDYLDEVVNHYGFAHDHSLSKLKCDRCDYVASKRSKLEAHKTEPHPRSEDEAMSTRTKNTKNNWRLWRHAKYCDKCKKWYPPGKWKKDQDEHDRQQLRFDPTLPGRVQGVQLSGLRVGDNCPFNELCPYQYRDFVGWYIHCYLEHCELFGEGTGLSATLRSEERERIPMFRCSSCLELIPVSMLAHHHVRCPASILPETVGPMMRQRAVDYKCTPGLLTLERGVRVMNERLLMGVFKEATDSQTEPKWTQSCLRAIRNDAFLHTLVERNQNAPKKCAVYTVCKIRSGTIPGFNEWVKEGIFYAGSTCEIGTRATRHITTSVHWWYRAGLRLEKDETLYLCRMSITIDETTCATSFTDADRLRLEQVLIDSLGLGTLHNIRRALGSATMVNDPTYRNHIAPRLNQLSLVLFDSTYKRLVQTKMVPDGETLWELPVTWAELRNLGKGTNMDSAKGSIVQAMEPATRVDQACSPIPFPRILSPEACDFFSRFQAERGFTDEEMADWVLTRKARVSISSGHVEHLETNEASPPPAESVQPDALGDRVVSSPDMFAYLYSEEPEEETPACYDLFDLADVPTTSKGPDLQALEELRASMVHPSTPNHADGPEPDESHMPAGESAPSEPARQHSPGPPDSPLRSEGSASKTSSAKNASGFLTPLVIGNRAVRIPHYGHRCTQNVDLNREPVSLTQDSSSEASIDDEPQLEPADASSVSSNEEPPQDFPDGSSESSLGEPSPADSGIDTRFDFKHVPGTGNPNIEDSADETTPKKPAKKAKAGTAPCDDQEEEEAVSDIYDKCAHTNCRQPQYENVNWVQCDDCDKWYHNMCILEAERPFEADEFHCGCAKKSKRKSGQAKDSKKRRVV